LQCVRSSMKVSLVLLSVGCVAFGVLAGPFVAHVAGPAAAGLRDSAGYATGALGAAATLPAAGASFHYLEPNTLVLSGIELLLGLGVLVLSLRTAGFPRLLGWLRRVHTGSVNDYAAFATLGMIAVTCALLL
jgi:multicomponent Na+:H+ antiporter subunit D